jgi:hypothetical protein
MDMKEDLIALVGQAGDAVGGDIDLVADARHIDHHPVVVFEQYPA